MTRITWNKSNRTYTISNAYEIQMRVNRLEGAERQADQLMALLRREGCDLQLDSVAFVSSAPHPRIKGIINHSFIVRAHGSFRAQVLIAMRHDVKEV